MTTVRSESPGRTKDDLGVIAFGLADEVLLPSLHDKDVVDGQDVNVLDALGGEFGVSRDVLGDLLRESHERDMVVRVSLRGRITMGATRASGRRWTNDLTAARAESGGNDDDDVLAGQL